MPALEALQDRFKAAKTATFGISVDSVHCHANWAASLGGISLPLLADFHPKGQVAESYGLYLADKGITDRATVIIDGGGVIRHISAVTPAGQRDIGELASLCEGVASSYSGSLTGTAEPGGLEADVSLYVKNNCGFSRATLLARDNLHLHDKLPVFNVSDEPASLEKLKQLSGSGQAPCLQVGGKPMLESADIIRHLVTAETGLWA